MTLPQGTRPDTISLMIGHPAPSTLLTEELLDAMQSVLSAPGSVYPALQYGPERGNPALIDFLVEKLNREQGTHLTPANLTLTAGSTEAVDRIARLFGIGGTVLVESPSYVDALHVLRDHRLELCPIPMDIDGLIVAELEYQLERLSPLAFLYTIPNFHNPTGITLSLERRRAILDLAQRFDFWIVEDDVYRDLSFTASPLPTFAALSGGERVLSIGSFSKTLAPGLRLGWVAGPVEAIGRLIDAGTTQMGGGANPLSAQIVAEYCVKGYWEPHIVRLRAEYQQRRNTALVALKQHMPGGVAWTEPAGGFFIWLTLPEGVNGQAIKRAAAARGVLLSAGEGFFVNPTDGARHVRITYSFAPLDQLETAIRVLAEVIGDSLS